MAIIGKIGDIELDDCVYRKQHKKCESCEYKENVEFGGELLLDVKDQVIEQKDKEIERLNNIINECAEDILKELKENHHLSYGVALGIRQKLLDYRELKEGK